ncbi:hypothetical protein FM112_05260 [Gulosibacter sp. 10]|nr:hypothetical protein FM112_05260 [Gulosibacter sp. 10]
MHELELLHALHGTAAGVRRANRRSGCVWPAEPSMRVL